MLPLGWSRRTILFLAVALLFIMVPSAARGQVFDLDRDRVPMAVLDGLWRFHTGDDPDGKLGWADPSFDDSSWSLLRSDRSWSDQGYKGYSGFGWCRFKVNLPAKHGALSIYIPHIYGAYYQVFADGRLIGEVGRMPPNERVIYAHRVLFPIPDRLAAQRGQLTFAIRVSNWPYELPYEGGDPEGALRIGDAGTLSDWRSLQIKKEFWSEGADEVFFIIDLLFGFGAVALFLLRPAEREYLWLGVMLLSSAAAVSIRLHISFDSYWVVARSWILFGSFGVGNELCYLLFTRTILKERFGRLYWFAASLSLLTGFALVALQLHWGSTAYVTYLLSGPFPDLCMVFLYLRGAIRGNRDARLLFVPSALFALFDAFTSTLSALDYFGYHNVRPVLDRVSRSFDWPFPFNLGAVSNLAYILAVAAIILFRFVRTRRDEERFKAELEAARTVQQVLIPEEIPEIAGLAVECVYKPAGQVGGDFFQVLPVRDGGALVVIGDVSGKGMPAAMAVSLLVGTVRTLAHFWQSPGQILEAMNQRMLARSKDGFTTCLVLRLDGDGRGVVANAGHLAPYVGGREVAVESGLPLGLVAGATYPESSFELGWDEQLTLVTDGVAEARVKNGELFGFERTASISILSAEHIAATAVAFGQEDDVTVLTVRRVLEAVVA